MAGFTRARIALAVALLIAIIAPASAEPVFPAGSQWGIEPPPGFAKADGAVAFTHPSGAVIMIVTSAKPHDFSKLPTVGSVLGKGEKAIRIDAMDELTVGGAPARLMTASALSDFSHVRQLMVQGESAGIILALVPASPSPPVDMAAVRTALFSARERRLDARQQLEGLPVKIGDIDGLRVAGTVANLGVILTDGPQPSTSTGPDQSFFLLVAVPLQGGPGLVPHRDEKMVTDHISGNISGIKSMTARTRPLGGANVIEASFERDNEGQLRQGVALARKIGDYNVVAWVQAPVGQKPDVARVERIFTSVSPK